MPRKHGTHHDEPARDNIYRRLHERLGNLEDKHERGYTLFYDRLNDLRRRVEKLEHRARLNGSGDEHNPEPNVRPASLEKLHTRLTEYRGENTMLLNTLQNAQRLVAEGKYHEADEALSQTIEYVLAKPPP